jgi:hypothetical protein
LSARPSERRGLTWIAAATIDIVLGAFFFGLMMLGIVANIRGRRPGKED